MKLSAKIPLLLSVTMIAAGVALSILAHVMTAQAIDQNVRRTAFEQLQVVRRSIALTGEIPDFAVLDDPSTPAALRDSITDTQEGSYVSDDPPVAWAAAKTSSGQVLAVRLSWQDSKDLLTRLDQSLVIGVGALVLVTAALALIVSRAMGRRLRLAEASARQIADGTDRTIKLVDVVGGNDEITELARAVDALSASANERLESEKRVTADIAHDLRTPLTSMITAADMLPESREATLVQRQAHRLWDLVEDLLEVARLDQAEQRLECEDITTGALARAAVAGAIVPIGVEVGEDAVVSTDPRRVQRILVNLLANAAKHGRPPVQIRVSGRTIAVADAGPGFPEDLVANGPSRFKTGASDRGSGHGLGLTIATGQARAIGAMLTFANVEGGAVATLTLPDAPPAVRPASVPQD